MTTTTTENEVSVSELLAAVSLLDAFVDLYDPARYTVSECAGMVPVFERVERLGAAGKTLAAHRVAESNLHAETGHRTPAEWLAATTGESLSSANDTLQL